MILLTCEHLGIDLLDKMNLVNLIAKYNWIRPRTACMCIPSNEAAPINKIL